jgi:hypothetical protein
LASFAEDAMLEGLDFGFAVGMLALGVGAGPRAPEETATGRLQLTIRISDHAEVPARTWLRAKAAASRVFEAVDVDVSWLDCPSRREETTACAARPGATELFAMVLPRPIPACAHVPAIMGLAVLPESGRASHFYVFHDRVRILTADHRELDAGGVLGHVMAHEIGHMLLGSNSHSAGGIMAARWFAKELLRLSKGDLLFTSAEASRIREGLRLRESAQAEAAATAP